MQRVHPQIFWESYMAVATKIKSVHTFRSSNLNFKNLPFKNKKARLQRDVYKDFYFDNICSAKKLEIAQILIKREMNKELYICSLKYYVAITMCLYIIKWKSKLQCKCIQYLIL